MGVLLLIICSFSGVVLGDNHSTTESVCEDVSAIGCKIQRTLCMVDLCCSHDYFDWDSHQVLPDQH